MSILGDSLAYLVQSPGSFHKAWWSDWYRQGNKSTTFWQRSSKYPDLDQYRNSHSNPGSLLVESVKVLTLADICADWVLRDVFNLSLCIYLWCVAVLWTQTYRS